MKQGQRELGRGVGLPQDVTVPPLVVQRRVLALEIQIFQGLVLLIKD